MGRRNQRHGFFLPFLFGGGDQVTDEMEKRSKYNVRSDDASKRTHDGIIFDSVLEMRFYRDVVLPQVGSGQITNVEMQKRYELQPKFKHNGKTILPIYYVADFYLEYADGHIEVIDTKGCPDQKAAIKRKMFFYRFPDVTYKWITYVKKYGGWIDYDDAKKLRNEQKRLAKKKNEKEIQHEQDDDNEQDFQ